MKKLVLASFGAAIGGAAFAQPVYVDDTDDEVVVVQERAGVDLTLGGGVSGFTQEELRDFTTDGGAWNARVTFGSRSIVAFEGSYIGSAQAIDALGLDDDAVLVSNGVQGAPRLNAMANMVVSPFIYGGLAWRRYDLMSTDGNTSSIASGDDVLEYPVGVGIVGRFDRLVVDVRGEFRYATGEDMVPERDAVVGEEEMHRWGINAAIGVEL